MLAEVALMSNVGLTPGFPFAHFARKAWLYPHSSTAEFEAPAAWAHWSGLGLVDSPGKRASGQ